MRQLKGIHSLLIDSTTDTSGPGVFMRAAAMLKRIAGLIIGQAWFVSGAAVTCTAVVLLQGDRGFDRAPFAIPAAVVIKSSWSDEVATFAGRLQNAFGVTRPVATEFSAWILEAAARQGVSPELMASVVFAESSFRTDVISDMGAIGPAQVKPYWSTFCGSANLADPAENIYCGAQILAHYRDVCGADECALSAYNVGMKNERSDAYYQQLGRVYARKIDAHIGRFVATIL
jgi:soluble lytic murein transglycosylase-like protein